MESDNNKKRVFVTNTNILPIDFTAGSSSASVMFAALTF
jgi:hypothetical protein